MQLSTYSPSVFKETTLNEAEMSDIDVHSTYYSHTINKIILFKTNLIFFPLKTKSKKLTFKPFRGQNVSPSRGKMSEQGGHIMKVNKGGCSFIR